MIIWVVNDICKHFSQSMGIDNFPHDNDNVPLAQWLAPISTKWMDVAVGMSYLYLPREY